jgi:hypothetical protein
MEGGVVIIMGGSMADIAAQRKAAFHVWDRNFFLIILAIIWFGIFAGFVPDVLSHLAGGHVAYAAIVNVHAAFYVGWLVLLTAQMSLIRSHRVDIHRRLGLLAVLMIPAMVVLGPWTGLVMGRREFGTPDGDPQLLSVVFLDALNFGVIATSGLLMHGHALVHRRLMLLATVFISGAGFARWLGAAVTNVMGPGIVSFYIFSYLPIAILAGMLVIYDLRTRGRVHPAVAAAILFGVTNNWIASVAHELPAWKSIAARLLGH